MEISKKLITFRKTISNAFRKKRMALFSSTFPLSDQTKILDVGGTADNWLLIQCPAEVTLLNLYIPDIKKSCQASMKYVQGDGTNIPFPDQSFDVVFSNSVIEHLYTFENQQKFANEVKRVGKALWIQTPSRSFFFEPHFLAPFFQFLTKRNQLKLARSFTLWGWITKPSENHVRKTVEEIRLLSIKEFQSLFADCLMNKEKFLGLMTKSFIAIKK